MSLVGWTLPQTPTGHSALLTAPPWHYAGDCLAVDFVADPDGIASLCPPGMVPSGDGSASVVFADWCSSADSDPRILRDPALSQYQEAYLVVYGTFRDNPVIRVVFMWVSSDLSLVRGLVQGLPKKLGSIAITRATEVGPGGVRKQVGSQFAAHLSAGGRRLITVHVDLERDRSDDGFWPRAASAPYLNTRLFPSFDGVNPSVHELAIFQLENVERGRVLSGKAELEIGASDREELDALTPMTVSEGHVYSVGFSLTGCQTFSIGDDSN